MEWETIIKYWYFSPYCKVLIGPLLKIWFHFQQSIKSYVSLFALRCLLHFFHYKVVHKYLGLKNYKKRSGLPCHNELFQKKIKHETAGVEDIEFPGVMKKEHMEIPGGQLQKKWNFQGWRRKNREISMGLAWFSILKFPRGVVQVSRKVHPHPLPLDGFFPE